MGHNIKSSVGRFFKAVLVLYWLSFRLYGYITSGSHFLKGAKSLRVKELEKNRWFFHENQRLFESFEIPRTIWFFHLSFWKTPNWQFFGKSKNRTTLLKTKEKFYIFFKHQGSVMSN
jgi:hypothetical protein